MPQVSVIVATYHPDSQKLCATLRSITAQEGVDLEIILCDDGSADAKTATAESYFQSVGFTNYKLVCNAQNQGTVKNCISGLQVATGEYVYLTSPGDLLFDKQALADFYAFCTANQISVCFGNTAFYRWEDGQVYCTRPYNALNDPSVYALGIPLARKKAAFFQGNTIIGACYFRKRTLALQLFETIQSSAIYMEDCTSTALALASDIDLVYYDRNLVWYEDGSGISTTASNKWAGILRKDYRNTLTQIKTRFPKDPYVDIAWANLAIPNRFIRILRRIFCHPVMTLGWYLSEKTANKVPLHAEDGDWLRLKNILESSD